MEPSRGPDSPNPVVRARAWCRVDLAGGTLDIWPLGVLHPGAATVNLAVDLAVTVTLRPAETYRVEQGEASVEAASAEELAAHPESALVGTVLGELGTPPVAVELRSESPRGGGLGASSAMAVALIAAAEELAGGASSAEQRAALARDLEARLMGLPTGTQDHWPALLGGALALHHRPGGSRVESLAVDLQAVGESLLVVYTGVSHFSAGQNWQVIRRRLDGEAEIGELFAGIAGVSAQAVEALVAGDLPRLGRLVGMEWELRRRLAPGISVPAVEDLLDAAREAGAWGGKACGAGGGGCIAVLAPPQRRSAIADRLADLGGRVLAAAPVAGPLVVERLE